MAGLAAYFLTTLYLAKKAGTDSPHAPSLDPPPPTAQRSRGKRRLAAVVVESAVRPFGSGP
jgi:hypothetical protein